MMLRTDFLGATFPLKRLPETPCFAPPSRPDWHGTAASVAAHRCRATGWRVAVIDHQPFGGTCALRGCDPKKVLIAFKRSSTAPVPQQHEEAFKADFDPSEASSVTGVFWAVT